MTHAEPEFLSASTLHHTPARSPLGRVYALILQAAWERKAKLSAAPDANEEQEPQSQKSGPPSHENLVQATSYLSEEKEKNG